MGSKNVLRRDFLGMLATGAAAAGIGTIAGPAVSLAGTPPTPQSSTAPGFDAWLGKIKGAHKQVYDATRVNHAMPLAWARVFLMTNAAVGVPAGDAMSVVVLRHDAIPMGMDDAALGEVQVRRDVRGRGRRDEKAPDEEYFLSAAPGAFPLPGMTIEELHEGRHVLFGICDMALTVYSSMAAKKMSMDAAEVKKEWVAGIMPGIQIVPSGVLAVNRAQEHGCTYVFAG